MLGGILLKRPLMDNETTYSRLPLWGGRERIDSVPPFIYDKSPEPINLYDVKAKLAKLHWEVEDIDRQLEDEIAQVILHETYNGNVTEWEDWKTRTNSARRIKATQIYIYLDWQKHTEHLESLQNAPITEAMKLAEKLRRRVIQLEADVIKQRQLNNEMLKRQEQLETIVQEILGIQKAC